MTIFFSNLKCLLQKTCNSSRPVLVAALKKRPHLSGSKKISSRGYKLRLYGISLIWLTTNDNAVWISALKSIFNLQPKNFHFNSLMNSTMSLIFLSKLGIFKCFYILRISMSFCWWNFMNSFIQFHNWSVECTHNSYTV